jgi:uncharacterized protein with PQ loop repeat
MGIMSLLDNETIRRYALLILGIACVLYATAGIKVGKTRNSWGRTMYRAKDPIVFWGQIFLYYLLGILGIRVFFT